MEPLLKVEDAKKILNCSSTTVYAEVAQGRLRCYRVGTGRGAIRFSLEQLQAYLKSRERGGEPKPTPSPKKVTLRHLSLD